MWWGLALGTIFVGLLGEVPREFVVSLLGSPTKLSGVARATLAGVALDLCSHGILLVGMKLYERGASLGQTMAFLIASPWNSLSLTIILISLIGFKWTLAFIILSMLIALVSGVIFNYLENSGTLPKNPHSFELDKDFKFLSAAKSGIKNTKFNFSFFWSVLKNGATDSKMLMRWLFLGVIIASLIRTFVPETDFQSYFGPSIGGLFLTLIMATVIEVCSEGLAPIGADLLTRAHAPGNGFLFLMSGVATDYTEILAIKEATRSWKIAFFLPLVTVPQTLILSYILNNV